MIRVPVAGLRSRTGQTVTVAGWVHALRLQRAMQFVLVRDHTGVVQLTHRRDGTALEAELEGLTVESAVRVTGRVAGNPVVSLGGLEIIPERVTVENRAVAPLPIDDNTGPEGRLDWRFLDVRRHPAARLVFAVQTTAEQAMREFAYASGCTEMHTPKLMGSASESGAEVFELGLGDHHGGAARAPVRRAGQAGRGEEAEHRLRSVLPGLLPVRLPAAQRPGPGPWPPAHGAARAGLDPRGHVPVPRPEPAHAVAAG
jgi:aspartyl-tRNA synthetase